MEARKKLTDILTANRAARAVQVAAHLGLADLVHGDVADLAALSEATGIDPWRLGRFMRFLTALGLFRRANSQFALTEMGQFLCRDIPDSLHPSAITNYYLYEPFAEIEQILRSGKSGFEISKGKGLFDFMSETPELAEAFDLNMNELHGAETTAMIEHYNFGQYSFLMDVGGGNGDVIRHILNANPDMSGCLLDLPHVVERAAGNLSGHDVMDRCEFLGGSFFEPLPRKSEAILIRHIIHDWNDDDAILILQRCREALTPGGVVLIAEAIIEDSESMTRPIYLDLTMLTLLDAAERTLEEYSSLADCAGLEITGTTPITPALSIMEARAR